MKMRTYLLVAAILVLAVSQVAAAPSYFGYTGLIAVPTTEVVSQGQFNFGGFFTNVDDFDVNFFTANIGVTSSLEAGATLVDPELGDSETVFNAKYQFMPESATAPSLAVGWADIADKIDSTPYLVVGKTLSIDSASVTAPKAYLGIGNGLLDGVFGGVSASLGQRTQLMAEYDSADFNLGARFAVTNELRLGVSLLDGDSLSAGLSYNKGF